MARTGTTPRVVALHTLHKTFLTLNRRKLFGIASYMQGEVCSGPRMLPGLNGPLQAVLEREQFVENFEFVEVPCIPVSGTA